MKRKIFSKLLMGAFLVASVSSFVSCKDYDDDINNLQKQIDAAALKADLNALQTSLQAQIAAAQSAAAAAQAAADAAQATANNAATKDALEAVKTIASNAGATAAQAITDAANAKADAANAAAAALAAQGTADNAATKDALEAVKAIANNAGTAAEKAAADAAKAIADAAAAQNTANVASTAAAAAQKAAEVAQAAADGASTNATKALADAASALSGAAAAQEAAKAAQATATSADATAKEAKATADNAIAAAGNATTQAAEALAAANAAKLAAESAKYNDEAVKLLIAQAQASADAAAQDAKDAAEAAAAAVLASASATDDAAAAKEAAAKIDEAIAEATEAIEAAADAKIKAAVAEVEAKIPADQSDAVEKLIGDLQVLAGTVENLATATALSDAVSELEGKLDTAVGEAAAAATVAAVAAAAGTFQAAFDALYTAVTSVELVGSFSAGSFNPDADAKTYPLGWDAATVASATGFDLDFVFGKMAWDATFGDHETESLDDDAVEKYSYKKGDDIRAERALLIRVNPTNATFTKDQVKFVNSKLETLDEIVEIGEPYRFKGMITRAESESGLWVIPVSVKKGITFNKFNETTYYKSSGDWQYYTAKDYIPYGYELGNLKVPNYKAKLYAVAIKNTDDPEDAEVSRYVASTYDIAATYENYYPATSLSAEFSWTLDNVDYKNVNINNIHNRWVYGYSETNPGIRSYDQRNAYTAVPEAMEKRWNSNCWNTSSNEYKAKLAAPTAAEPTKTQASADGKLFNTVDDNNDARFYQDYLTIANVGDPIKVELTSALKKKAEFWYISYDFELNAVESKPSEWEAWQSYQDGIEGIYKTVRGDQSIDLIINKSTAKGDVIGFRIWAVNYDGSLIDPDGKAFYVKVGEEPDAIELKATAEIKAVDATTGMALNYLTDEDKTYTPEKNYNVSVITPINGNQFASLSLSSWNASHTQNLSGNKITNGSVDISYALLKSDKKTVATDWKDVAYIKAGIPGNQLKQWKNGSTLTYSFDGVRNDVNNKERYRISITFKKVMPTDAWTKANHFDGKIVWKPEAGYDAAENTLTVYPKPYSSNLGGGYVLNPHYIAATTSTPAQFWWRWNGTAASPLADFIDDATWLTWTADAANAGVRNMYDYISKPETTDAFPRDLYQFEFKNLPTELVANVNAPAGAPATADYVTEWDNIATNKLGDKAVVAVRSSAVRSESTYTTNLKYTYKDISLTRKGDDSGWNTATGDHDWVANATSFKTDFKDALDLLSYGTEVEYLKYDKWEKNSIDIPVITSSPVLKDDKVYISWKTGNGTFNWSTAPAETQNAAELFQLALDDHSVAGGTPVNNSKEFVANNYAKDYTIHGPITNDLTTFLKHKIRTSDWVLAQGALVGTNYTGAGLDDYHFVKAHYEFDNPATTDVDETGTIKVELKGQVAKYLKIAAGSTVDAIIFEKISGIASPTQNWDGTIEITGYDVFGKGHTYQIPVVLLYNF